MNELKAIYKKCRQCMKQMNTSVCQITSCPLYSFGNKEVINQVDYQAELSEQLELMRKRHRYSDQEMQL